LTRLIPCGALLPVELNGRLFGDATASDDTVDEGQIQHVLGWGSPWAAASNTPGTCPAELVQWSTIGFIIRAFDT